MKTWLQTTIIFFAWVSGSYAAPFPLVIPDGFSIHSYAMDDSYIFLGAPSAQVGENSNQGAVLVYERTGDNTWEHATTLHASDGDQGDYFGYSLAYNGVPRCFKWVAAAAEVVCLCGGPNHLNSPKGVLSYGP